MSESVEMWLDPGVFSLLSKDYRVIAFDQRGHGQSDKPHLSSEYGLKMVDDVPGSLISCKSTRRMSSDIR